MRSAISLLLVSGLGIVTLAAQEMKPAPVLSIQRESIKEGRSAAHEKVEAEWAATARKVNFPQHWVAYSALSGTPEVWFVEPMASFVAAEENAKAADKEPAKSAFAMLDSRDGELRSASRAMWAVYREDLSYRPEKFNPAKAHYVEVSTFRTRLGRGQDFSQGARQYMGAMAKGNVDLCLLAYQVVAGAPDGTYLYVTMMDSLKVMDGEAERSKAIMDAMGAETLSAFMKGMGDVVVSIEDTLFEAKPGMSYSPKELIDGDPAFWKPKPAPKPAPATGAAPADSKK